MDCGGLRNNYKTHIGQDGKLELGEERAVLRREDAVLSRCCVIALHFPMLYRCEDKILRNLLDNEKGLTLDLATMSATTVSQAEQLSGGQVLLRSAGGAFHGVADRHL